MNYRLPLAAVRVLDLGMVGPGAYCARLLGDMGAEVIGIEGASSRSPRFSQLNCNKLGCALDWRPPRGRDLLLRLAGKSNVVIESFDGGERERLGLTYEALRAVRPDIIVASVGSAAPEKARESGIGLDDVVAGIMAAGAVSAALLYHRRSGEGQQIEVDARDCALSFLGELVVAQGMGHSPPPPTAIPLLSPDKLLSDPHLRERRFFEPVSHPEGRVEEMAGLPWRFSQTPGHVRLPAPSPGEHNSYVFGDILRLSLEEMTELEREGVIAADTRSQV